MCPQMNIHLVCVMLSHSDKRMDMTRLIKTAEKESDCRRKFSQPTALTVTTFCCSLYNKLHERSFMLSAILKITVTSYEFL
jgi:hypothetical protein